MGHHTHIYMLPVDVTLKKEYRVQYMVVLKVTMIFTYKNSYPESTVVMVGSALSKMFNNQINVICKLQRSLEVMRGDAVSISMLSFTRLSLSLEDTTACATRFYKVAGQNASAMFPAGKYTINADKEIHTLHLGGRLCMDIISMHVCWKVRLFHLTEHNRHEMGTVTTYSCSCSCMWSLCSCLLLTSFFVQLK